MKTLDPATAARWLTPSPTRRGWKSSAACPRVVYRLEDARAFLEGAGLDPDGIAEEVDGRFMGAFVRARKPEAAALACCAPGCCS